MLTTARAEPTKAAANLVALDELRVALERLESHGSKGVKHVRAKGYQLYHAQVKRWFLLPAGERLRSELEKLRTAEGKTRATVRLPQNAPA